MNTRILVATLISLVPAGLLNADIRPEAGHQVTAISHGTVIATVLHSETGAPLAGLPVYITKITATDPTAQTIRVLTGKNGIATVKDLENGLYSAVVSFNNHESEIAYFKIDGEAQAFVTLRFNPDID